VLDTTIYAEPSWPWSYGNWIYNYLFNHHWCCEFESRSGRGV